MCGKLEPSTVSLGEPQEAWGCLKLDQKLVKPNVIPEYLHQDVLKGLLKNGLLTPGGFDAVPKGGAP